MANWTGFSMTNHGAELQAKVNTGNTTLTFTKLALGSGEAEGSLENMTELSHKEMDMTIKSISNEGNIVTLKSTITNEGISQAFYAREMGLYATDPDLGEILYAIQTDPQPDNIPAEGSATVVSEDFTANLIMSNTGNVSATLDPHALMTLEDLEKHNADEAAHEAAFTLHNGKEDAHAAAFAKHNEDATAHAAAIAVHNTDGSAHSDIRQLVTAHNTNTSAHANLLRVASIEETDEGIKYTTQDGKKHGLNLWNKLKSIITGTTVPNGNKNSLFQQIDGVAYIIKKITGEANWYDAPSTSLKDIVASLSNVSAISDYDVDDPNAWWVKLRGEPGLIIQGINKDINGADNYNISFPISFTSSLLYAKSSEYTKTSTRMNVAPQAWNSTKSNKTSAVFLQDAVDPTALSVSVICVGY